MKSRYQTLQYFNTYCILSDNSPLMCVHLKEAIALLPGTCSLLSSFLRAFLHSPIQHTVLPASRVPGIGCVREQGLAPYPWELADRGAGSRQGRHRRHRGCGLSVIMEAESWGRHASRRSAGERRRRGSRSTRPLTRGRRLRRAGPRRLATGRPVSGVLSSQLCREPSPRELRGPAFGPRARPVGNF